MFTVIYTIMHSDYYGLKYTNLYRPGNHRNYSNCGPAQIPIQRTISYASNVRA